MDTGLNDGLEFLVLELDGGFEVCDLAEFVDVSGLKFNASVSIPLLVTAGVSLVALYFLGGRPVLVIFLSDTDLENPKNI